MNNNTSKPLEGQSALVTGAGRGIGRAIATHLAEQGAHVYVVARSQDQLDSVVQEIEQAGGKATSWAADLSDSVQAEKVAADFA